MVAESAGKQLDAEGDTYMSDESSFYGRSPSLTFNHRYLLI